MSDEVIIGPGNPSGDYGDCGRSLAAPNCSTAPNWYTAEEMRHYLRRQEYSDEIADELSAKYAENLQRAFNKGYQIGRKAAR